MKKRDLSQRIYKGLLGLYAVGVLVALVAPHLHHYPKYEFGECLIAYDLEDHSKMQVKVVAVETYIYKVKVLEIKDNQNENLGLEERTMFGPIKLIDKQKDVYRVDCDATVWRNDAGQ